MFQKFAYLFLSLSVLSSTAVAADKKGEKKEADKAAAITVEQFSCASEIYYTWQPNPPQPAKQTDLQNQQQLAQQQKPEKPDPIEEFFIRMTTTGTEEQSTKDKLKASLEQVKGQAIHSCENKHQAMSSCVASKMRTFTEQYQGLDFDSRRALLDSITSDCQQMTGRCLSSRATDITCSKETVTAPAAVAPEKEEKKKK